MNYAVLGAGISGLTIGRLLVEKGHKAVLYEACGQPGGLAKSRIIDGYIYNPHGGHIFNSNHKEIVDWVFSILPKEKWNHLARNAKIFMGGRYISYPFELALSELPTDLAVECAFDYMNAQKGAEPGNFYDWLIWRFGNAIAHSYLIPYNQKVWDYSLEKMETLWMSDKMPLPDKKSFLRSLLAGDPSEKDTPHSSFYYPLQGGFQSFIHQLALPLDLRCNHMVTKIVRKNNTWWIDGEGPFDCVVSTIPLKDLPDAMGLPDLVNDAIAKLRFNSLTSVLYSCHPTDITWVYLPETAYRCNRVSFQSTINPNSAPSGMGSGALEIIGPQFPIPADLLQRGDILPAEFETIDLLDSQFTKYAYVVHDLDYRKNVEVIREYIKTVPSFSLLGRWATWNYHNMDLCMLDAFKLVREIS